MRPDKTYTVERTGGVAENYKRALVSAEVLADIQTVPIRRIWISELSNGSFEYEVWTAVEE